MAIRLPCFLDPQMGADGRRWAQDSRDKTTRSLNRLSHSRLLDEAEKNFRSVGIFRLH